MDYKSDDKTLEISVNDLKSRILKLNPKTPVEYGDLEIVLDAVLDLRKRLDEAK
jgi:hypothetical protein